MAQITLNERVGAEKPMRERDVAGAITDPVGPRHGLRRSVANFRPWPMPIIMNIERINTDYLAQGACCIASDGEAPSSTRWTRNSLIDRSWS